MHEHTHKQFDAEMEAIRTGVLGMGGLVETQINRAIKALTEEQEPAAMDAVGADEHRINDMQIVMDHQCSQIIAKRQPAAIDLRMILTITKIVNDLERIGDEAKKIAYKAAQMHGSDRLAQVRFFDVVRSAQLARELLQSALDAFARLDVMEAARVIRRDEEIDAAFSSVLRQLISYMMEDPRTISSALEIVFMAKSIERIGDHAKNIAEQVIYIVKGRDVRHTPLEEVEREATR